MIRTAAVLAFLVAIVALAAGAAAQSSDRRVALVIGESRYQFAPHVANTANDARLVARTLKRLGFELVGGDALVDLDKAGLERAIRSFSGAMPRATAALFYYAGHGLQLDGANYLVPIDANPKKPADRDFELIDAAIVLHQMEGSGARLNLIILDACRNNPFGNRDLRGGPGGLAQMIAPKGTLISYPTQPGGIAIDAKEGGDDPFAAALAATLTEPGRTVFELFNEVGVKVERATNGVQQPWLSTSPIEGDFYFVKPAAPAAADPRQAELTYWESIKDSATPAPLKTYLERYPGGEFASLAQARIAALARPPAAPPRRSEPPGFDGTWRGIMACDRVASFKFSSREFAAAGVVFKIADGRISATVKGGGVGDIFSEDYRGTVAPDGTVVIAGEGAQNSFGNYAMHFDGAIRDGVLHADGNGRYEAHCTLNYRRR